MLRRLFLALLAIVAAGAVSTADAKVNGGEDWVLLGTREVDLTLEKDTIDVTKAKGRFKAVRLEARRAGIELSRVQVVYGSGAVHNEDRQIKLLPGERTRAIDLRGEDRFVDTVSLIYKSEKGASKKAVVEVWGLQTPEGAKAARGPAPATSVATAPTSAKPNESAPGTVTAGGDVLFGAQEVGFGVDRDVIRVGGEIGKFDRIRLRVLDNDIFINELKVLYLNGDADTLAVNAEIKQNSRTQWFKLKGDRFIREIQLLYRSKPSFKGQARVEVYGEFADGWLGPNGEGRKYNKGWVLLGAQTAGTVGFDRDVIPVGRNEGGFKRVRVTARNRTVTLKELRVIYGSGQEDVIPVNTRLDPDGTYGPIDLKGGTRVIKEIQARYRSRIVFGKGKGRSIVEVWGQH